MTTQLMERSEHKLYVGINPAPLKKVRGFYFTCVSIFLCYNLFLKMENNRAKSFVTIMIIIATLALFLRFALDGIIKFNISQNESNAQGTLKLISAALENYAKDNHGIYPAGASLLTKSKPPYLDKDYIMQSPAKGYIYACARLESSGYSCNASPVNCKLSGNMAYSITTGSLLVSEECQKRE